MIPPDFKQCQVEERRYNPWVMGGRVVEYERCRWPAYVLLTEKEPGKDGKIGKMTVCVRCLKVFLREYGEGHAHINLIEGG